MKLVNDENVKVKAAVSDCYKFSAEYCGIVCSIKSSVYSLSILCAWPPPPPTSCNNNNNKALQTSINVYTVIATL